MIPDLRFLKLPIILALYSEQIKIEEVSEIVIHKSSDELAFC